MFKYFNYLRWPLLVFSLLLYFSFSPLSYAEKTEGQTLNKQIQNLKKEVLKLNRDLFILEEELLFPANTQIVVFVSLNSDDLFSLDSIELKINDKTVAQYLYTNREQDALRRGGVQQLFSGNIRSGKNELVAFFTGKGPRDREYRRGTTFEITKTDEIKYVELIIQGNALKQQPEFSIKEW